MAGKDVDLIIRAKDRASSELDKISKALKKNVEDQKDLAKGAASTSGALGKLANDAAKFENELNKLKSAGKVAAELDRATSAVSHMEGSLKSNTVELAKMARESENAAQAANRLKGQLSAEETSLASNKAALAASRKELTDVNKLVREAERNQERYNKALGTTPDHFVRPAAKSAGAFIAADLPAQKAQQAQINKQIKEYESAIDQSASAIKNLRPQVSAATSLQNQLANETARASQALGAERQDLASARTELDAIRGVSAQAGTALGGVAISQEQVSAAAQRMAANLAAAKARIEGLSNVKTTSTASTAAATAGGVDVQALTVQRRAVLEARKEWVSAQNDVKALAQQMKSTAAPTEALGAAFGTAQAKARLASEAYDAQRVKLANLKGQQGDLTAFLARTATAQQQSASAFVSSQAMIARGGSQAAASQQQLAPAIRASAGAATSAAGQTSAFGAALSKLASNSRETTSLFQGLRGEILSLTASYIGFQAAVGQISGAIDSYRQLEAVQSRLGSAFNQDTGKVSAEIQFLQQTADRLGMSFGVLADEYGKFTVAAKAANFTSAETRKVFLSVAEAARVNKLSTDQTSGVFLALTQMISKGKVSAEELRGQLGERLTGAFNIFATAIGKTTAQLDVMMQKGEVLADRSTLLKFADELNRRFGPQLAASLNSVSADLGRFENSIFNAQLSLANGFIPSLRSALKSFNEFAQSTAGQETFANVGKAIGDVIRLLAELPKYFDLITVAAKAFVAVKVAQSVAGIGTAVLRAVSSIVSFNRELQIIGPRTQAAANSQNVFSRGLAQTVSTLGSFRTALLASTSQSTLARAGVVGLAGSVGALQTVLVTTAGIARAFLAAFGGPIGIAITAITFAVGQWITSVDKATAAVGEHKRQMDIVSGAYQQAKGNVEAWGKEVRKAVSATEAEKTLSRLVATYEKQFGGLEDIARGVRTVFETQLTGPLADLNKQNINPDIVKGIKSIVAALDKLKAGGSIADFRHTMDELAQSTGNSTIKEVAANLLEFLSTAKDGEDTLEGLAEKIAEASAQLHFIQGTASEAEIALLKGKGAVEEANEAFDRAAAIKTYTDAIDTLKGKIPGLADELKKLKEITDINKAAWEGLVAAFKTGNFSKVAEIISLWGQARNATQMEFDQKRFDSLPDSSKKLVDRIIFVEGGQTRSSDTNKAGSSAQGIGQFTSGTWLPIFNRLFPALSQLTDAQKLEYRYNEQYARPILEQLTKQNQMALANAGVAPTDANTYLAHFLGSGDAIKVALANPDELAKNIVQGASVAANPTVIKSDTTVRDLQNWAYSKVGGGSEIMSGGETKQENFDENIAQRVKGWKEEANARKESNREGTIAKALAEAEAEATRQNTTLTQEQRDAIREAAGAKYDSAHADEQLKANQEEARQQLSDIIGLDQQRKNLLQEINMAQNSGDNSRTAELKEELVGVNQQLADAIPKALQLAKALGDEKMVAQLQKVSLNTEKLSTKFTSFGMSASNVQNLVGSFADGLVNAFDSFAQAVANGENAFKALGQAFLQFAADFLREIASMILKQLLLNMLAGVGGPIGTAAAGLGGVATGHTGGLVGASAIGSGNMSRSVSPSWFSNVTRYHTGGVVGFQPDEVPAVLKRNEEVLTQDDPRHRFNMGTDKQGGGKADAAQSIKQVLVLDQRELANAMASSHGEKVIITTLKNNAQTIKKMLG
ncbi:tape measure protein [Rhizobium sp. S152]|uniref:tape measure protein n=1 Tax=Rhizobium sp. S152 TaxID=3055038 RepID=UPI0025AA2FDE|nr:tape measure protein [Rhizobium sp. S152]MDM9626272.1 tape measure protein [Rhizobium sp. S152]